MRCTAVRRHLMSYLLDRLPARRQRAIAAHLAACSACRAELDASRAVWDLLGELPAGGAAPDMSRAVQARVAEITLRPWLRLPLPSLGVAATACAMALCYCVGFGTAARMPDLFETGTVDELTQALAVFQEVPPASLADAYLSREPEAQGDLP